MSPAPLVLLIDGLHAKSGGGITYLRAMVPRLAAQPGVSVHLCLHESQRPLFPEGSLGPVVHHWLDYPMSFWGQHWHEQIQVPRLARRIRAGVTFAPANYGPLLVRRSVVLLRNALTVANVDKRPAKLLYWLLVYLATAASLLACRRAIAVSGYARRAAAGPFMDHLVGGKISIVPHGVDPLFAPPPPDQARDSFLLAVSDLYIQKNLHTLLEAFARIAPAHPEIGLFIAGKPLDAQYFARLQGRIAALGLESRVEFLGHQPAERLVDLYRRCRAFVFPSTVESFGNPLAEALACGAPVACSNTAAMPEVAGEAALYFDPHDAAAMAEVLNRILGSESLRAELSAKSLAQAVRYSWDRTADATLAVLRQAAV
ncbi:MAG: glycosyltransferase family 4 protein [Magnetospirillum sp. WYHS-4]